MTIRILVGECRERLRELPEGSAHCVVTRPPYFALRDYRVPPAIRGGDPACRHEWSDASKARKKLGWQPRRNFRELVREMVEADIEALGAGKGPTNDVLL